MIMNLRGLGIGLGDVLGDVLGVYNYSVYYLTYQAGARGAAEARRSFFVATLKQTSAMSGSLIHRALPLLLL